MLTDLDETLMHQTALPMAFAASSDHRFFDRYFIALMSPTGDPAMVTGMGCYKNMNVLDGFACFLQGNTQSNRRFSRPLAPAHPGLTMRLGPLVTEIVEPYRRSRYACDAGTDGNGFDLAFTAFQPPRLERQHLHRADGRLTTDYWRTSQTGHARGSLRIGGRTVPVDDWYLWRDHSWGIRPGVGGFEPVTGTRASNALPSAARAGGLGMVLFSFQAITPSMACSVQFQENENGAMYYIDGTVHEHGGAPAEVVAVEHDATFLPGTRRFSSARLRFTTTDGRRFEMDVRPVLHFAARGCGYESGFTDGKGLGVYRGDTLLEESDRYVLGEGDAVTMPDGTQATPWHREGPNLITVNGEAGFAHGAVMVFGRNPRYGFV